MSKAELILTQLPFATKTETQPISDTITNGSLSSAFRLEGSSIVWARRLSQPGNPAWASPQRSPALVSHPEEAAGHQELGIPAPRQNTNDTLTNDMPSPQIPSVHSDPHDLSPKAPRPPASPPKPSSVCSPTLLSYLCLQGFNSCESTKSEGLLVLCVWKLTCQLHF